ncbi:MAG: hypothetical protein A3C49_03985 [Candidatus Doudnabacteria bacterium RIFCSPHIGHO2_02_FULL_42_25]|uniref:GIY-YIG domain-containing protein n=1 Tax=Candidatus Doudnabacteria bacterium RIFCSPHIGHO2_01_FULL_41_86 TaxID=1817821 RepID=A0A1F5N911_9BACT|nr:MAG: hypothetical protein A2717_00730 [Candidatus Doudnabacteria bacterium RIFCSPHIGHO2_01_FULL_41_86]OGE75369.1 MAG: hypothetical protein A3K07_01245 [Candidatus Doudnabacteria bacterium RIFCSPHIGHO2_01_43_10]OGE86605.1 MAG: hypothetical protein A3E28_04325 [Candidatus Doudnabacteria bacterium RIFCSPHIGHO2_12_FULL_42_22]OGE87505.1 MAG: hypothetical protein A3C49_03985 [Candidatus Doudnabacteria bacterium RIFCSPHIGHO2_02_FULL_42_25]OGE92801.1 MAG: hypothetical protein A2895_04535 [Candidatus
MYYVYILLNLDEKSARKFYIGVTDKVTTRVDQHNHGLSQWTSKFGPWRLIYFEAYLSPVDAGRRERQLKHHGKGFHELKKRLESSINDAKKVRD